MNHTNNRPAALYISHGAGPLPLLGDAGHWEMVENLRMLAARMPRPKAVVLVSAHWEEPLPTITGAARPELVYDYYGFPLESYEIEYPAPGDPDLARSLAEGMRDAGVDCRVDGRRGFDHGMFVPLKIMYPEADIPCVQVSLVQGLDPAAHLGLGRLLGDGLAKADREGLLVIGSGFSFHNMGAFFETETPETRSRNRAFQDWLAETCCDPGLGQEEREARLLAWESAPHARYCHPREEHLLPLHVCCGLAGRPADERFELTIFGKKANFFLWE